jgi:hypothetical protein
MISVLDETGATNPGQVDAISLPLRVRARDHKSFEGIPLNHAFLMRTVRVKHRLIAVWIQFGHPRLTRADLTIANRVLRSVRVS